MLNTAPSTSWDTGTVHGKCQREKRKSGRSTITTPQKVDPIPQHACHMALPHGLTNLPLTPSLALWTCEYSKHVTNSTWDFVVEPNSLCAPLCPPPPDPL